MEVHDERVPDDLYAEFLAHMPQVCVEVVLDTDEGVLIAKRENEPRIWFWPGGRLYKGERLDAAAHRVAREELGIDIRIEERLGVYAHFWDDPDRDAPSRHTVNVVFRATPDREDYEISLDDQHSAYRFLSTLDDDLHEYVRRYVQDNDLL